MRKLDSLLGYLEKEWSVFKKEQEIPDISEAHQKMVIERYEKVRKIPERLVDWDEAKKRLRP